MAAVRALVSIFFCVGLTLTQAQDQAQAAAPTVELAWNPHPDTNVIGYRVHVGFNPRNYAWSTNVGFRTNAVVSLPLAGERYHFALTAQSVLGGTSPYSDEVTNQVPPSGTPIPVAELVVDGVEDTVVKLPLPDDESTAKDWIVVDKPVRGEVLRDSEALSYRPEVDYDQVDSIRVVNLGAPGGIRMVVYRITVKGVDDPPVALSDEFDVRANGTAVVPLAGLDADRDFLTYRVTRGPLHGTLTGEYPEVSYTPEAGFEGQDTLLFVANDGRHDSEPALVSITVRPANRPPVVKPYEFTVKEDELAVFNIPVTDEKPDLLTYIITTQPKSGTVGILLGEVIYTPYIDAHGIDRFEYLVRDSEGGAAQSSVTLVVEEVNDRPEGFETYEFAVEGVPVQLDFAGVDVDDEVLTYRIVEEPKFGTLELVNGIWVYRANEGFVGIDSVGFVVSDGELDSDPSRMELRVFEKVKLEATVTPLEGGRLAITLRWGTRVGHRYQLLSRPFEVLDGWVAEGEVVEATSTHYTTTVVVDGGGGGTLFSVQLVNAD
ncbi:MAG: tandem-95 repeat protein [Verrucomicrobiales bacterium]|nr:tandem-95 repeat protein [Verrucomicrobiales bacterium]